MAYPPFPFIKNATKSFIDAVSYHSRLLSFFSFCSSEMTLSLTLDDASSSCLNFFRTIISKLFKLDVLNRSNLVKSILVAVSSSQYIEFDRVSSLKSKSEIAVRTSRYRVAQSVSPSAIDAGDCLSSISLSEAILQLQETLEIDLLTELSEGVQSFGSILSNWFHHRVESLKKMVRYLENFMQSTFLYNADAIEKVISMLKEQISQKVIFLLRESEFIPKRSLQSLVETLSLLEKTNSFNSFLVFGVSTSSDTFFTGISIETLQLLQLSPVYLEKTPYLVHMILDKLVVHSILPIQVSNSVWEYAQVSFLESKNSVSHIQKIFELMIIHHFSTLRLHDVFIEAEKKNQTKVNLSHLYILCSPLEFMCSKLLSTSSNGLSKYAFVYLLTRLVQSLHPELIHLLLRFPSMKRGANVPEFIRAILNESNEAVAKEVGILSADSFIELVNAGIPPSLSVQDAIKHESSKKNATLFGVPLDTIPLPQEVPLKQLVYPNSPLSLSSEQSTLLQSLLYFKLLGFAKPRVLSLILSIQGTSPTSQCPTSKQLKTSVQFRSIFDDAMLGLLSPSNISKLNQVLGTSTQSLKGVHSISSEQLELSLRSINSMSMQELEQMLRRFSSILSSEGALSSHSNSWIKILSPKVLFSSHLTSLMHLLASLKSGKVETGLIEQVSFVSARKEPIGTPKASPTSGVSSRRMLKESLSSKSPSVSSSAPSEPADALSNLRQGCIAWILQLCIDFFPSSVPISELFVFRRSNALLSTVDFQTNQSTVSAILHPDQFLSCTCCDTKVSNHHQAGVSDRLAASNQVSLPCITSPPSTFWAPLSPHDKTREEVTLAFQAYLSGLRTVSSAFHAVSNPAKSVVGKKRQRTELDSVLAHSNQTSILPVGVWYNEFKKAFQDDFEQALEVQEKKKGTGKVVSGQKKKGVSENGVDIDSSIDSDAIEKALKARFLCAVTQLRAAGIVKPVTRSLGSVGSSSFMELVDHSGQIKW
jgi:Origin recognition complex (ORC) subunit 3 N-terminus/Origin recognition complex winged helix C-terminal